MNMLITWKVQKISTCYISTHDDKASIVYKNFQQGFFFSNTWGQVIVVKLLTTGPILLC